jgi:hypothetical protein
MMRKKRCDVTKRRIALNRIPLSTQAVSQASHTTLLDLKCDARWCQRASCVEHSPIQPGRSPRRSRQSQDPLEASPGSIQSSVRVQVRVRRTHILHPRHLGLQRRLRDEEPDREVHPPIHIRFHAAGEINRNRSVEVHRREVVGEMVEGCRDSAFAYKVGEMTTCRPRCISGILLEQEMISLP